MSKDIKNEVTAVDNEVLEQAAEQAVEEVVQEVGGLVQDHEPGKAHGQTGPKTEQG